MANPPTTFVTGFWPVGDIYPLLPVWSERHSVQGLTANARDEEFAWFDIVAAEGVEWSTTLTFIDMGVDLVSKLDDVVPATFDHLSSRIWKSYGFAKDLQLDVSQVVPVSGVWAGDALIVLPVALQASLGTGVLYNYSVDLWLTDAVTGKPYSVRGMMGTIVVR